MLRIAARRVAGSVEVGAATVEALRGLATIINQIAKAANQTRDPDFRAFMEARAPRRARKEGGAP